MAEQRTGGPYIWVPPTLAKLLTGENACEWAGWFKAHHRSWKKPPSDFDSTKWMLEHTALVNRETGELREHRLRGPHREPEPVPSEGQPPPPSPASRT